MDITGEGFKERSPAMLFNSDRGNGTDLGTTWELLFTEGVYFKTEGGDNEDENPLRVNGIQPDGIRDFGWEQTSKEIEDHTHILAAKNTGNPISVSGNTNGTSSNHYHTLETAINGSTEEASHSHDGEISMEPSEVVVNAPSTSSKGVGPVIAPTPEVPATDGHWVYGNWQGPIPGHAPTNTNGWEYRESDIYSWDYGDWEPYGFVPTGEYWNSQMQSDGSVLFCRQVRSVYTDWSDPPEYYGRSSVIPPNTDTERYTGEDLHWSGPGGTFVWDIYISRRSLTGFMVEIRLGTKVVTGVQYERRTKTWVPGTPEIPYNPGSGSVNAVSSVNTSFTSFSVNTSGISLGGDGSHSHTISIPTSGSSNENGHTHAVLASGIADINVSGSTISGGAHSHTFNFQYSELIDINNQNTRIASETTVKNRKMRIWRRTA
jgi:hypothetical protein